MTGDEDFVLRLGEYLDECEGSTPLPDRVRDALRAELAATPQRPALWSPARRSPPMSSIARFAFAAAAVAVVAILGYSAFFVSDPGPPSVGGEPTVEATQTPATPDPNPPSPLAAGSHVIDVAPLRVTVTVPEGWESIATTTAGAWVARFDRGTIGFRALDRPLLENCSRKRPLGEVRVDGFVGEHYELLPTGRPRCEPAPVWYGLFGSEGPRGPRGRAVMWVIDVDGQRLAIGVYTGAGADHLTEVRDVVATLQIDGP